jgi:hypothetical protein
MVKTQPSRGRGKEPDRLTGIMGRRHAAESEDDTMSVGEAPVKQAVKWLDKQLHDDPTANRVTLVDAASRRFDLSPLDAEFLYRHLASRTPRP